MTAPTLTRSYYCSDTTKDWPYVLLLDGCGPSPDDPLPMAVGVRFITSGAPECNECRDRAIFLIEDGASGAPAEGAPFCAACSVGGDHRGFIPTCYVDLVPYDE